MQIETDVNHRNCLKSSKRPEADSDILHIHFAIFPAGNDDWKVIYHHPDGYPEGLIKAYTNCYKQLYILAANHVSAAKMDYLNEFYFSKISRDF
jgi:hypothetical protein